MWMRAREKGKREMKEEEAEEKRNRERVGTRRKYHKPYSPWGTWASRRRGSGVGYSHSFLSSTCAVLHRESTYKTHDLL